MGWEIRGAGRVYYRKVRGAGAPAPSTAVRASAAWPPPGRASLLAETLTTHGAALARLGRDEQARRAFDRAAEVACQSGAVNDAGLAALTLIEELGERMGAGKLEAAFERAHAWLSESQHPETLRRMLRAAGRVLSAGRERRPDAGQVLAAAEQKGGGLRESVRRYERQLIRQALDKAQGSVTQAARLLGVSYQSLGYLLDHRHTDLLPARTPVKRRRRSIIKK